MIRAIFSYFAYSVYMSKNLGQTPHIIRAHLANSYNAYNSHKCISEGLALISEKYKIFNSSTTPTPQRLQLNYHSFSAPFRGE
jgi:hypothetical protein